MGLRLKTVDIRLYELPLYVVVILFFLMLLSGILVPIYSDEIAIHLSRARYLFDGFKITGLFPQCESSWLRSPLWSEYPAVIFNFIFRPSGNPLYLRISGIAFAVAWFFLVWFFLGKAIQDKGRKFFLWSLLISICALGPLPYVMVLARPEQVLLFLLTLFCIFALYFPILSNDEWYKILGKLSLFFCALSFLYFSHPKAIFFAPFVFFALYFFSSGATLFIRAMCLLLFLGATYQAVTIAMTVTQCAEAPGVIKVLSDKTLSFADWKTAPVDLLKKAFFNIGIAVDQNIFRLAFTDNYQSSWIPSASIIKASLFVDYVNAINRIALYFFYSAGAVLIVIITLWKLFLREDIARNLLGLSLLGGIVLNAVMFNKVAWNFYTPGLMIPLFIFAVLLVMPDFLSIFRKKAYLLYVFVLPWCVLAFLNLIVLGGTVTPSLIRVAKEGELIIQNQLISTPILWSQQSRETLDHLIEACHLPYHGASRLAVDGVSYGYMKNMHQPVDVLYVSIAYGMDIPDLGVFLRNIQSDGILSRCDYLPATIVDRSVKLNNMCCLSRDDLQR